MAGSTIGNIVKLTTFGESHGPCIGAVLDGIPAGMALSEDDIQPYLDRRRPGKSNITTARKEEDKVRIVSGIFEGLTTGTPIALLIENNDQHSSDYAEMQSMYRPGHADFTYDAKYGFRDYRGGGRSSGRETAARVAAGAIAEIFLKKELGIDFCFYTAAIGDVVISRKNFDRNEILRSATAMPDDQANARAVALIEEMKSSLDSVGGMIEGRITGVPAGIGDPVFDKLDARLCGALMSIGAVKAAGIGDGMFCSYRTGSQNNDVYTLDGDGRAVKVSNHGGGIYGGISDGDEIVVCAYIKPTASIAKAQPALGRDGTVKELTIRGRHDPCIVPRAVVVCECMSALTILDAMLMNMSARAQSVRRFYLGDNQ